MPVRKSRWVYVCLFCCACVVGTTCVSMLGRFQVLMALPEPSCECCVVSVRVCVCVCECLHSQLCLPVCGVLVCGLSARVGGSVHVCRFQRPSDICFLCSVCDSTANCACLCGGQLVCLWCDLCVCACAYVGECVCVCVAIYMPVCQITRVCVFTVPCVCMDFCARVRVCSYRMPVGRRPCICM